MTELVAQLRDRARRSAANITDLAEMGTVGYRPSLPSQTLEWRAADEIARLRTALQGVVDAWVNPGDGGPFEAGEVPALDAARAALSNGEYPADPMKSKAEGVK